jgi:Ca2+-binding EF-hand superfamily protein
MNFRLRQERNAFVFLVVVVTPLVLLTAPIPYLLKSSDRDPGRFQRTVDDATSVAHWFARADRNRDGFIDADEAAAIPGLLPIFALVDADGNGKVDRGELTKVRPARSRPVESRI